MPVAERAEGGGTPAKQQRGRSKGGESLVPGLGLSWNHSALAQVELETTIDSTSRRTTTPLNPR